MNLHEIIPADLMNLRDLFVAEGDDLRFVGGFPRDIMAKVQFKDIDLATNADPDKQIAIYKKYGIRYYETGLDHGTISVGLESGIYEITSLRTESNHDGRHATVAYTRDWLEDLSRRDLTINAMSITFDGELIDPYNGAQDLKNKVVRFVGNPDERLTEDYLRILRFFRFHARIAEAGPMDSDTREAVARNAPGLVGISRERVWMEMAKIIAGKAGPEMIEAIISLNVAEYIDLPTGDMHNLRKAYDASKDPVVLVVAYLNDAEAVAKIAADWKWSAADRDRAVFIANHMNGHFTNYHALMARDGFSKDWVVDLATVDWGNHGYVGYLRNWDVPVFPVTGKDLMSDPVKPMKQGKEMGVRLKTMKDAWAKTNYAMTKEELMRKF
jgi:tRNA nucleotidyltransferase/poly(A) polymerase